MVYTCFDMIRDCREDRATGWSYFVSNYVPLIRTLILHYRPHGSLPPADILLRLRDPQSSLFASLDAAPERAFLVDLRQRVLELLDKLDPLPEPELEIDLEALATALESLTLAEKQAVWLEIMHYSPEAAGAMLRMAETTVARIREKAAALIRGQVDAWRQTLLLENGRRLGIAAAASGVADCLPARSFLDIVDGRTTWRGREDLDRHVSRCWHCVDHFCRILEGVELLRFAQTLNPQEAEPFRKLLGLASEKRPAWKRPFKSE
jgi:hypothetical protein